MTAANKRWALVGFACIALSLMCGCLQAKVIALSTLASVADARGTAVVVLVKLDHEKQESFRKRSEVVKTGEDLNKLVAEHKDWVAGRDKGLLGIDASGLAIDAARKNIVAGKYDLAALLAAYSDLKALLDKIGVKMPAILGGL